MLVLGGVKKCSDIRSDQQERNMKTKNIVDGHIKSKYPKYNGVSVRMAEENANKELKSLRREIKKFQPVSSFDRIVGCKPHDDYFDLQNKISELEELLESIREDKKTLYFFADSVAHLNGDANINPFLKNQLGKRR